MKINLDVKPGTINILNVYHDDWCKSNTKKGRKPSRCNCNPEYKMETVDEKKKKTL